MALNYYRKGRSSIYACRADQRFSYCSYLPESYKEEDGEKLPLVVLVHGSQRNAAILRDQFIDFAEANRVFVLAPLFPAGIEDPEDLHNYKYIDYRGLRFDLLLLKMVEELSQIYWIKTDRFLLHGFSGGAQFAQRFHLLHPNRLMAVSVAAPGTVSLLDDKFEWWAGTRSMKTKLGIDLDLEAIAKVPVQLVVGDQDVETWDITVSETSAHYVCGANASGTTRIERIKSLKASYEAQGVTVRFDLVAGVGHQGAPLQPAVMSYFYEVLAHR